MQIMFSKSFSAVATLFLCLSLCAPVWANGGGSGAGGRASNPSQSAPQIDPVATYQKAVAHLQAGEYKKAEKDFRKVLKIAGKDANTNFLLGLSYIGQEKFKKAIRPLKKAVKYDPKLHAARGQLALSYLKTGKSDRAQEQRQILLEAQAKCADCSEKTDIDTALQTLDVAATEAGIDLGLLTPEIDDGAADTAYLLAVGLINQKDYQTALTELKAAARALGPHPDVLTYQGFAHRKLGDFEQAIRYYRMALAINPDHLGANEYLGEYFVELGDMAAAQRQLEKLNGLCHFGCQQAEELQRWIDAANS